MTGERLQAFMGQFFQIATFVHPRRVLRSFRRVELSNSFMELWAQDMMRVFVTHPPANTNR